MRLDLPLHTRRTYLRTLLGSWAGGLLAGLGWPVGRFLFPRLEAEPKEVRLPLADCQSMPPDAVKTFAWGSKPGLLMKKADGSFRVFKGTCSHLDCNVRWRADVRRFHCPCHEGWYDEDGRNVKGPPPRPLTVLFLSIEGAEVVIRPTATIAGGKA